MKASGAAALDLPWLCPSAASLAALARSPAAAVWTDIRHDPGCVLLLARVHAAQNISLGSLDSLLAGPQVLEAALQNLAMHHETGWIDWRQSQAKPLWTRALAQALLAERIASALQHPPAPAWTAALLSPLGYYALAAVQADLAQPLSITDHTAMTRRLNRAWRLPTWLSAILGHLHLPVALAEKLGADPRLFQIVQLALVVTEESQPTIPLARGLEPAELCLQLGVSRDEVQLWSESARATAQTFLEADWQKPREVPLLEEYLRLALTQRRQGDGAWIERLQQEVDLLQEALDHQRAEETIRLERLKLAALGELAAGAGHEINNPLAVISGQAQYILRHLANLESEWQDDPAAIAWLEVWKSKVGRSLQTIVGQTQRIHHILTDLMQFARPNTPRSQEVRVAALVREAAASLAAAAQDKHLRVEMPETTQEWITQGDGGQLRTVLVSLVRNAIEAAPPEGAVVIRLESSGDHLNIIIEDNGPGPSQGAIQHLFDPFYSGRAAGRGRGLGLSTAWRLARQNGGDVRFDGIHDGQTRFVLRLSVQETPRGHYFLNNQGQSNGLVEAKRAM